MRQLACINRLRLLSTFSYRVKVILFNYATFLFLTSVFMEVPAAFIKSVTVIGYGQVSKQRRSKGNMWMEKETKPQRQQRRTHVTNTLFYKIKT